MAPRPGLRLQPPLCESRALTSPEGRCEAELEASSAGLKQTKGELSSECEVGVTCAAGPLVENSTAEVSVRTVGQLLQSDCLPVRYDWPTVHVGALP
ncbi:hypothetical protein NDU88_007995 [Pleurodeles waltl]|uniref:Uncharacterized protein n=1 Tax=Pleurodeles waltl TaxID=8319 RepID=A0AAV7P3Q5_PLEWA|nr:hypothetical protein NDU88_007995 [Pleurodeles waltl]